MSKFSEKKGIKLKFTEHFLKIHQFKSFKSLTRQLTEAQISETKPKTMRIIHQLRSLNATISGALKPQQPKTQRPVIQNDLISRCRGGYGLFTTLSDAVSKCSIGRLTAVATIK